MAVAQVIMQYVMSKLQVKGILKERQIHVEIQFLIVLELICKLENLKLNYKVRLKECL
jgi:hypothetical protein